MTRLPDGDRMPAAPDVGAGRPAAWLAQARRSADAAAAAAALLPPGGDAWCAALGRAELAVACAIDAAAFDAPWDARRYAAYIARHEAIGIWRTGSTGNGAPSAVLSGAALLSPHATDPALLLFVRLAVAPEARRLGLGTLATRWTLAFARARGASRVRLHVREANAAARALYARLGFAEVGRVAGFYAGGSAAMRMECDVDAVPGHGPGAAPAAPPDSPMGDGPSAR